MVLPSRLAPGASLACLVCLVLSACDSGTTVKYTPAPVCEEGKTCRGCACPSDTHFCGDEDICAAKPELDEPCTHSDQCVSGFCFEETCKQRPGVGEPCDACSACTCLGVGPIGLCSSGCTSSYYPKSPQFPDGLHSNTCDEGFMCLDKLCRPACEKSSECPGYASTCASVPSPWLTGVRIGGACRSDGANDLRIPDDKDNCPITRDGLLPEQVELNRLDGGADAGRDAGGLSNRRFVFVRAGIPESCGIRDDNTLVCWAGQLQPAFMSQRLTWYDRTLVSCGLKTDQTISCFNANEPTHPLLTPPSGKFTAVSMEGNFACALSVAGAIRCWGSSSLNGTVPPTGTFMALATGDAGGCGVASDGAIRCWGGAVNANIPTGKFEAIDGHGTKYCAIEQGGRAVCWGLTQPETLLVPPADVKFASIVVEGYGACGITHQRSVVCFGSQGGRKPPVGEFDSVAIESNSHACALDLAGQIQCWALSSTTETLNKDRLMPPAP